MASTINVGVLRALLTLDSATFESGLREASGSVKKFESNARKLGANLSTLGSQLTASVSLPIIAGFGAATKAAIDFESSFAGVRKTVDASEAEFDQMAKQFRTLAQEIPVSVDELNRLGEAAGALGIPKADIVEFSRVMAELGVTTNVTSEDAANAIAKIQTQFGASGQATENFASTLVDLGNKGASTEREILELAERVASAGHTIGLSQAQVLGWSAAIANVGMDAEAGGSAISRVFKEISQMASAGGADLARVAQIAGTTSEQFAQLFKRDASAAMQQFVEGLGRIQKSGGDLNTTLDQLGFKELRQSDLLRRLAGASEMVGSSLTTANQAWTQNTALSDEAGKRFGTLASQLTTLWNQFKEIAITLGTALLPLITALVGVLKDLMPVITFVADTFAALPVPIQAVIVGMGLLVAAIGPALFIIGQIATGVAALTGVGGFAGLAASITGFLPSWGAIVAAGGAVVTFFTTTLPAAFAAVITFLGPQGLIALAVIALGLVWYKWGDQISALVQKVYTAVKTWLLDKLGAIWDTLKKKIEAVGGYFKQLYEDVVGHSYVPDMVRGIGDEFNRLDSVMVGPARRSTSLVSDLFYSMKNEVVDTVFDMLRDISRELTGWLDGFMPSWAAKLLGGLAQSVMSAITNNVLNRTGIGGVFGGGLGLAGGGAGAGAGAGGIGSAIAGLATNPFTIAAAGGLGLGMAIWKKGLFRGGEEAINVNPRRDQFLAQFGAAGTGSESGFQKLAAQLTAWTGQPGGGSMFAALQMADSKSKYDTAQAAIIEAFSAHGKQIKGYSMGGFVPPGVVQPAILHGGSQGEIVAPVSKLMEQARPSIVNVNVSIQAWDGADVKRTLDREFPGWVRMATVLNTGDINRALKVGVAP